MLWDGRLRAGTGPNLDTGCEIVLAGEDARMGAIEVKV